MTEETSNSMLDDIEPKPRDCPICAVPSTSATLYLESSIDPEKLSSFSYASRKTPEFMSHQLVQCKNCDLVYAPKPPSPDVLARAYHSAAFDSSSEADDAADAYTRALRQTVAGLSPRNTALEIGTGTGAFLRQLSDLGFSKVVGVEPSQAAIDAAASDVREKIQLGIFVETDFAPASLDFVCCFMTLEHVADPKVLTAAVFRLLRPGGVFAVVVHDRRSFVNRLLGRRSPIIDVEHLQLFSRHSVVRLFTACGFSPVEVNSFKNRYELGYWLKLSPVASLRRVGSAKNLLLRRALRARISMNVGNLVCTGIKPT